MRSRAVVLLVVTAWLAATAGCSGVPYAQPAPTGKPAVSKAVFRINVGDQLLVKVLEQPELTATQRVLHDGTVQLPVVGSVPVVDLTVDEIQAELVTRYSKYLQQPMVTVQVTDIFVARAFFLGEVKAPGAIPLHGPTTILQGISQVEGFNEQDADKTTIRIIRPTPSGCPEVYSVDAAQIMSGCSCDVYLHPGDVVYVHPTGVAKWGRALASAFAPLVTILQPIAQLATVILAIDSVADDL